MDVGLKVDIWSKRATSYSLMINGEESKYETRAFEKVPY